MRADNKDAHGGIEKNIVSMRGDFNERLDETNRRLDETNRRLDETNKRLDETNTTIRDLDKDTKKLTEAVSYLRGHADARKDGE